MFLVFVVDANLVVASCDRVFVGLLQNFGSRCCERFGVECCLRSGRVAEVVDGARLCGPGNRRIDQCAVVLCVE